MIKVILHGCGGAMGRAVSAIAQGDADIEIVAGIGKNAADACPYPVFSSLEECTCRGDGVPGFSGA